MLPDLREKRIRFIIAEKQMSEVII